MVKVRFKTLNKIFKNFQILYIIYRIKFNLFVENHCQNFNIMSNNYIALESIQGDEGFLSFEKGDVIELVLQTDDKL